MRECKGGPNGSAAPRTRRLNIPRVHLAAVIAALTLATCGVAQGATTPVPVHHYKHHPECRTAACARQADRLWAKHHPPKPPPMSALEVCVLEHETTNRDPNAVNGIYMGIGQWEQGRWESDGGLRYGRTPLDASYAEQEKVLRGEGEAGMIDQQGQYDGCA